MIAVDIAFGSSLVQKIPLPIFSTGSTDIVWAVSQVVDGALAPFWADLRLGEESAVYVQGFADAVVVQWDAVSYGTALSTGHVGLTLSIPSRTTDDCHGEYAATTDSVEGHTVYTGGGGSNGGNTMFVYWHIRSGTCNSATWSDDQTACLESAGTCAGATPDVSGTTTKALCDAATTPGTFTSSATYVAGVGTWICDTDMDPAERSGYVASRTETGLTADGRLFGQTKNWAGPWTITLIGEPERGADQPSPAPLPIRPIFPGIISV
jgi:hypothetical protein